MFYWLNIANLRLKTETFQKHWDHWKIKFLLLEFSHTLYLHKNNQNAEWNILIKGININGM